LRIRNDIGFAIGCGMVCHKTHGRNHIMDINQRAAVICFRQRWKPTGANAACHTLKIAAPAVTMNYGVDAEARKTSKALKG
jgi:hypothetical protein